MTSSAAKTERIISRNAKVASAQELRFEVPSPKGGKKGKTATLHFGSVSMKVKLGSSDEGIRNITLGQAAMRKMKVKLANPGVKLRNLKNAPLFYADPSNPRRLIRVLNGKREYGIFENGKFKVIP